MGSWSEACGFSGLEIAEQEPAYVMLLSGPKHWDSFGPYAFFAPTTLPLRGTYNDYGYLEVDDTDEMLALFNEQSGLTLTQGETFSLDMLDGQTEISRFWIHGSIMDKLDEIKQDFPYVFKEGGSVKVNNIGEAIDIAAQNKMAKIQEALDNISKIDPGDDGLLRTELMLMRMDLRDNSYLPVDTFYANKMQSMVRDRNGDFTALFAAKRRNSLIAFAAGELRKHIVPSEGVGPQHDGSGASKQFARMILDVQAQRSKDRDMEDEEES